MNPMIHPNGFDMTKDILKKVKLHPETPLGNGQMFVNEESYGIESSAKKNSERRDPQRVTPMIGQVGGRKQ